MAIGSVFSETPHSITTAKLFELSNKRATFDTWHAETVNRLQAQSDSLARITASLAGVKHCFGIETRAESTSNLYGQND